MATLISSLIKRLLFLLLIIISSTAFAQPKRDIYEIRVYHFASKAQESKIDNYLKSALLPALHRAKILHAGVFKPVATDTASAGKTIYVFIPYGSIAQYMAIEKTINSDKKYTEAGADYLQSPFDAAPYTRVESILMQAFVNHPQFNIPPLTAPAADRVYELRSYESATEKLYVNKVQMFNLGDEIGLFKRLGFNAVFYADVLAGSHMPNLMYMTTFNSMAERDEHWKSFGADPVWKKLSSQPEYQHNVSKADIFLLHPTEYSDL